MSQNKNSTSIKFDMARYGAVVVSVLALGILLLLTGVRQYPVLLGMAVVSYTFGLRHAFDVDHIAAIDNMTRKMINDGKNTRGVGFSFSIGHSLVVIIMGGITIFAVKWAQHAIPAFQSVGGSIGTLAAGIFLLILALFNTLIVKDIVNNFRAMRDGHYTKEIQEASKNKFINRQIERLLKIVNHNWQVVIVGFLFGLGFDTATQIAVLATSATAADKGIPWFSVLSFPILFTAGMCMMDTLDGFFMSTAYKWVFSSPFRKVYYNLTITILSILAAGVIGIIEVLQVLSMEIGWTHGFWLWLQNLDFNFMGFMLVGMFAVVWAVSLGAWKLFRLGEKDKEFS
jgi:high-affinity nickel-transport protein